MTDGPDPDEFLRAANPVDERRLPHPSESPRARATYEKITGRPYRGGQTAKRRHGRWRFYLAGIVGLAGAGGGVGYALTNSQPTVQATAGCYARDSLKADVTEVSITGGGALQDCAAAWKAGEITGYPAGPPPPLQACVLPTGPAGVFPDRQGTGLVCKSLGLNPVPVPASPVAPSTAPAASAAPTIGLPLSTTTSTAPATTATSIPPVAAATNLVASEFAASCVGETQAEQIMHQALSRYGLTNWTIVVGAPFTAARPCASPSLDETQDTAYIIPVPPYGPQVTTRG